MQNQVKSHKLEAGSWVQQDIYETVLQGLVNNVKHGPFKATSGVDLPYYLNAPTNFLDKNVAPHITKLLSSYVKHVIKNELPKQDQKVLIVGMETAGGMIVSQLAAAGDEELNSLCDMVYMRKKRKTTGTLQQLEGPSKYRLLFKPNTTDEFTFRTASSPPLTAIWIDDVLSTGASMLEGLNTLKDDYNIIISSAVFLVDRSIDRVNLTGDFQHLASPAFQKVRICAVYDLQQVDDKIPKITA